MGSKKIAVDLRACKSKAVLAGKGAARRKVRLRFACNRWASGAAFTSGTANTLVFLTTRAAEAREFCSYRTRRQLDGFAPRTHLTQEPLRLQGAGAHTEKK